MSNLYDDFEKKFANKRFLPNWIEIEPKKQSAENFRKDLRTLQSELEEIQKHIEIIAQKQLRLANLAKFYQN